MAMEFNIRLLHVLFFFIFLFQSLHPTLSDSGSIGINYGRVADNLPSPAAVVQLLKAQGITKAKIFDSDATVLSAFSGSGISLIIGLKNEDLPKAAGSQSFTDSWLQSNIVPYHPNTIIEAIAVGNEVLGYKYTEFIVPAAQNIHASLVKQNLDSIKVSSPISLDVLGTSYPPSAGAFKSSLIGPVLKPFLSFLRQTKSYLMLNAYPYFAYRSNRDTISLDYALFRDNSGVTDPKTNLVYKSLLEAQIDSVLAAMNTIGINDVNVVVTETGWPSKGDGNEADIATLKNAASYNGNLVRRVLTGGGTPLKPNAPLNVYIFALFNENQKPGTTEENYGLFYPNQQKVYDIPLTRQGLTGVSMLVAQPARGRKTWCVANEKAGEEKLREGLRYACGEAGGVDCRQIKPGGKRHKPNTLLAHATHAFNGYYQKNGRRNGTCDFGGAALVISNLPEERI